MDRQEALAAYAQAVSREREEYLYQQALRKAQALMRSMSPGEKENYLSSQPFMNTLYQQKRRDKVYQALQRGELTQDYHLAEFDQLCAMIQSELNHGNRIDLPFLRSVERSRVTLGRAHGAVKQIEKQAPRRFLGAQQKKWTG